MCVILECDQLTSIPSTPPETNTQLYKDIEKGIEEIISSIPFLLAASLPDFIANVATKTPLVPGRPVGGLLLMHALYVLMTLPVIDLKLKVYIQNCLRWIGDHMGIGQATILSKVSIVEILVLREMLIYVIGNR